MIGFAICLALAVVAALVFNHGAHNLKDFPTITKDDDGRKDL